MLLLPSCPEHNSLPTGVSLRKQTYVVKSVPHDHTKHSWRDQWWLLGPRAANPQGDYKLTGGPMQKSAQSETLASSWTNQSLSQESELRPTGRKWVGWVSKHTTKGNSEASVKVLGEGWLWEWGESRVPSTPDSVPSLWTWLRDCRGFPDRVFSLSWKV